MKAAALLTIGAGATAVYFAPRLPVQTRAVAQAGGAALIGLGLFRLLFSKPAGSLGDQVLDTLLPSPSKPGLTGGEETPINQASPLVPNETGIAARWVTPGAGQAVRRNRFFGNEYDVEIEVENHSSRPQTVDLEALVVEDDFALFGGDTTFTTSLGRVSVSPFATLRVQGVLAMHQQNNPFALDVKATLLVNREPLDEVSFVLR